MPEIIKRWCECDPARAERVGLQIRLWCVYFGLVALGVVIATPIVYMWGEDQRQEERARNMAEVAHLQEAKMELIRIIQTRLPEIADAVSSAAVEAQGASATSARAARRAESAVTTADRAAQASEGAAREIREALATPPPQPPPADVPAWLDGP